MFWTDYCEELDGNLVFLLLVTTSFSVPWLLAWSVDLAKFWCSGLTASSSFDSSSYDSREHRSLPGNASHRATMSFLQTNTLLPVVITNSLHISLAWVSAKVAPRAAESALLLVGVRGVRGTRHFKHLKGDFGTCCASRERDWRFLHGLCYRAPDEQGLEWNVIPIHNLTIYLTFVARSRRVIRLP